MSAHQLRILNIGLFPPCPFNTPTAFSFVLRTPRAPPPWRRARMKLRASLSTPLSYTTRASESRRVTRRQCRNILTPSSCYPCHYAVTEQCTLRRDLYFTHPCEIETLWPRACAPPSVSLVSPRPMPHLRTNACSMPGLYSCTRPGLLHVEPPFVVPPPHLFPPLRLPVTAFSTLTYTTLHDPLLPLPSHTIARTNPRVRSYDSACRVRRG